jgi:uncharacterized iron-regulated membrane protein
MMSKRGGRWNWLTLFALFNLVFWILVTVAVALVIGDQVDLGVEALIREWQVTAVAAWEQVSTRTAGAVAQPTAVTLPQAVQERPTSNVVWPDVPTPVPDQSGEATPFPPEELSDPLGTPSSSEPSAQSGDPSAKPLLTTPLLIADPDIAGLVMMDTEMAQSAPGRAVQIRYDQEALNRELAILVDAYPELPYRNVQAVLQPDQVVVSGQVTLLGIDVKTEVQGRVVAQACLPWIEVQTISIAGVVAPGFFETKIKEVIDESLSWYPADYPLCLEQIVLEDGRVTIYGSRR